MKTESLALSPLERAFYGDGVRLLVPASYEELKDIVREAEAHRTPLIPTGLGSQAYLGNPPPPGAVAVSLRKLNKVLRFEPADYTIGVQAGLSLAELRATLRETQQEIPMDFAASHAGTIGGLVASSQPGPRRGRFGLVRSYMIGIHALRGGPSIYKSGGMVVKNVAGYEVAKLLAGSLGTAGFILEINFKLRPLPSMRAAGVALFAERQAAWDFAVRLRARNLEPSALWLLDGEATLDLGARGVGLDPGPLDAVAWLFEGNGPAVAWQEGQAAALLERARPRSFRPLADGAVDGLLDFLAEFPTPAGTPRDDLGIARLGALPTEAPRLVEAIEQALAKQPARPAIAADALSGLVTVRWRSSPGEVGRSVAALQAAVPAAHGSGLLLYLPAAERRQHPYLLRPDPNRALSRRILQVFDPHAIFSPGRLHGLD